MNITYEGADGIYRTIGQHAEELPELEHARGIEDEIPNDDGDDQWWEDGEDDDSPEDCVGFWEEDVTGKR